MRTEIVAGEERPLLQPEVVCLAFPPRRYNSNPLSLPSASSYTVLVLHTCSCFEAHEPRSSVNGRGALYVRWPKFKKSKFPKVTSSEPRTLLYHQMLFLRDREPSQ
jgi:hypothetical protein